jgi:hypothetical protein
VPSAIQAPVGPDFKRYESRATMELWMNKVANLAEEKLTRALAYVGLVLVTGESEDENVAHAATRAKKGQLRFR